MLALHCSPYRTPRLGFASLAPGWPGVAALLIAVLPVLVRAGDAAVAQESRSDANWLQAIQSAARQQSFSGTVVYQRGDEVHASRVVQYYDGVESRERVLPLDGQPREFIRNGDEVQCLYPHLRRIVVEHGGVRAFPAFAEPLPGDVLTHYALHRQGMERIAGSMCEVVELVPRDKLRYGYRLWVEPTSGLLFKAQTLNERGAVLEQIAFTDVHVGQRVYPALLKPSWSTVGWTVDRQQSKATELRQQGWSVTAPSGFHRLAEVMRHLVEEGDSTPRAALQAVYSDGLATVSVFIEPAAPALAEAQQPERRGPVSAVSRQVGDARVTVVGEVPPATAQSIAESVVRSAPPR